MGEVRVGIIGAGGIAHAHTNALSKIEDVNIVGIADIDFEKAKNLAEKVSAKSYSDFKEMLNDQSFDALWLCTPPMVREEPIITAIEKNIPIFVEKPVSDNLDTAYRIAEKINQTNHPVAVGYVLRYLKITEKVKSFIKADAISVVSSMYCCPMSLDFREGKAGRLWFFNKNQSGGPIGDQATHLFDMLRYLIGDVNDICGFASNVILPKSENYTIEDVYAVSFKFKNNILGTHIHSWGHRKWVSSITLIGEQGRYIVDFANNILEYFPTDGAKETYQYDDDGMYSEDLVFVNAVRTKEFSGIKSTFIDAVKTLEFTTSCLEKVKVE